MKKIKTTKSKKKNTINLPPKDLTLEHLKQLIANKVFKDEIPFDFLADHYPELLTDWYPGYPCKPRMMTKKDPVYCRGHVANNTLTFLNVPGLENMQLESTTTLAGEYDVWLQIDDQGQWFVRIID